MFYYQKQRIGIIPDLKEIIHVERFGDLNKLLRVTCYVFKFINNLKYSSLTSGNIQCEESEFAKQTWIRNEQKFIISDPKRLKDLKYSLGIFTDEDNILRLGGRLKNIDVSKRFPILLDNKSHFTKLIIIDCHKSVKHSLVKDTLNQLRALYWVPQGRRTVKKIISECVLCKMFDAKVFATLPLAPLPDFRVNADYSFSSTGVDYFGPLLVKNIFDNEDETRLFKVHAVLYTCSTSRAVSLDLVTDTSCAAFIRSLKRFTGRYGISKLFISDNATCFTVSELTNYVQKIGTK